MWPTFRLPLSSGGTSELIDSSDLSCSALVSYVDLVPGTHIPNAQVGDLAVVVTIYNYGGTTSYQTTPHSKPSGWKWFMKGARPGFSVQYKILEASDLTNNTRWIHECGQGADGTGPFSTGYICAHVWTFRTFNEVHPFDDAQNIEHTTTTYGGTDTVRGAGGPGAVYVYDNTQWIFDILYYRKSGSDWPNLSKLDNGTGAGYLWTHAAVDSYLGNTGYIKAGPVRGYQRTGKNLIEGESISSTLTNWTAHQCTIDTSDAPSAVLQSASITGGGGGNLPYAEYSVDLEEGQVYTFNAFLVNDTAYSTSVGSYLYSSVVDPSSNEFGASVYAATRTPSYVGDTAAQFGSGRGTWWDSCLYSWDFDGIPHISTGCNSIWFTAQQTGTYKLRVGISQGNGTPTSPSSSQVRRVAAVSLYEGYTAAQWTAPGEPEQYRSSGSFYWLDDSAGNSTPLTQYRFALVRGNTLPRATFHTLMNETAGSFVDTDGLTIKPITFQCSTDARAGADCTRIVYPTISGVAQKYYAEFTIGSSVGSGNSCGIAVRTLGFGTISAANGSGTFPALEPSVLGDSGAGYYGYFNTGSVVYPGSGATVATYTAGDVIGVSLDFSAAQLKWWKNGSLVRTDTIDTDVPHELAAFSAGGSGAYKNSGNTVVANVTGPFTYLPSGFNAWDIHNEVP